MADFGTMEYRRSNAATSSGAMAMKILVSVGTRPEAIKLAPLIKELERRPQSFAVELCATAQHREMLDQVLQIFEIEPAYDLSQPVHRRRCPGIVSFQANFADADRLGRWGSRGGDRRFS